MARYFELHANEYWKSLRDEGLFDSFELFLFFFVGCIDRLCLVGIGE
jgi:hypothetical protein